MFPYWKWCLHHIIQGTVRLTWIKTRKRKLFLVFPDVLFTSGNNKKKLISLPYSKIIWIYSWWYINTELIWHCHYLWNKEWIKGETHPLTAVSNCMTSTVSKIATEEFWPTYIPNIASVHWGLWTFISTHLFYQTVVRIWQSIALWFCFFHNIITSLLQYLESLF